MYFNALKVLSVAVDFFKLYGLIELMGLDRNEPQIV